MEGGGKVDRELADYALGRLGVDTSGLDRLDRELLSTIATKFDGGPVGLGTLAASVGEEAHTIEEVYEPYLIQQGYLKRTPAGGWRPPVPTSIWICGPVIVRRSAYFNRPA